MNGKQSEVVGKLGRLALVAALAVLVVGGAAAPAFAQEPPVAMDGTQLVPGAAGIEAAEDVVTDPVGLDASSATQAEAIDEKADHADRANVGASAGSTIAVRFLFEGRPIDLRAELVGDLLIAEGDIVVGSVTDEWQALGADGIVLAEGNLGQIFGPDLTDAAMTETVGTSLFENRLPGITSIVRKSAAYRWPSATVPYVVDAALSATMKERVGRAINHWNTANTPIKLVAKSNQADYVRFIPDADNCASKIGRQGGPQSIRLKSACSIGSIIHEIGHAVGLFHEQSRWDRDNHVTVNLANVESGKEFNFNKQNEMDVGPFDFGSIMLYDSYAFSKNGKPTITKKDGSTYTVQRTALSVGDKGGVEYMYGPGTLWVNGGCARNYGSGQAMTLYVKVNATDTYKVYLTKPSGTTLLVSQTLSPLANGQTWQLPGQTGEPGSRVLKLVQQGTGKSTTCSFNVVP